MAENISHPILVIPSAAKLDGAARFASFSFCCSGTKLDSVKAWDTSGSCCRRLAMESASANDSAGTSMVLGEVRGFFIRSNSVETDSILGLRRSSGLESNCTSGIKASATARYEFLLGPAKAHVQASVVGQSSAWADLRVVERELLGQQKGYTLYIYCSGAANVCSKGHTSSLWPPMIAYHKPVAGPGVNAKKLGTKKINGKNVVTYYGNPLYRYKGDTKPGQTNGEAKNKTWYVVTQFGQPLTPPGY